MADKLEVERIRAKAIEIVELSEGMSPRLFLAALAIAAGSMITKCWPPDKREDCMSGHASGVRYVVEQPE